MSDPENTLFSAFYFLKEVRCGPRYNEHRSLVKCADVSSRKHPSTTSMGRRCGSLPTCNMDVRLEHVRANIEHWKQLSEQQVEHPNKS